VAATGLSVGGSAGQAAGPDGSTVWVGGGDIVLQPAKVNGVTPTSVDFTISGAGPLVDASQASISGSHTASPSFTIPYTLASSGSTPDPAVVYANRVTQPGLTITVTALHMPGGGVQVPSGSAATLTLNVDNQGPQGTWTGSRTGAFEAGCTTFPYLASNGAVEPGTDLDWNYSLSDSGSGVTSLRVLNYWQRVNHRTDSDLTGTRDGVLYADFADNLDRLTGAARVDFPAPAATQTGTFHFTTYAHGKAYALYGQDALGNGPTPDRYTNLAYRGQSFDRICNAYWEKSGFPTTDGTPPKADLSNVNPDYKPELSHHNIPEIDAIARNSDPAFAYSVTLTGLRASPAATATKLCYYCVGFGTTDSTGTGTVTAKITEVRFYRRLTTASKLDPFEYVGRLTFDDTAPLSGDTLTFTSNAVSKTDGRYAVAAAAFNDQSAVGFVASDETPVDSTGGGPNGYDSCSPDPTSPNACPAH
ncbi:MAG TPA: hypothetical protein VHN99_07745, partial [Deinococcales bacterium]|nr:hypothetical protein [Deinococcales bacterium]